VCHEDLTKAFDKNPHAVLEKSPRFNLKNSCESCHGPGEAHATNGGDKTKIISFKAAAKKQYNRQCLACHAKEQELTGFKGSMHAKSDLACADCHRVHAGAHLTRLLKEPINTLCMNCHVQRKADFSKPFHHRVREGSMRCTDCHQPHGGLDRRQLRLTSFGTEPCLRCHSEKSGPFVFNHAPLKIRDCLACHEPHGSNNTKMLVRSTVRALCLECHSFTRNVLTAQPPAFHDVRSPRYQNCTTCHTKIHGSNSSQLFLR
jgi:DmsE family decaheme c-type cytochrome